jgi:hypothetical protein
LSAARADGRNKREGEGRGRKRKGFLPVDVLCFCLFFAFWYFPGNPKRGEGGVFISPGGEFSVRFIFFSFFEGAVFVLVFPSVDSFRRGGNADADADAAFYHGDGGRGRVYRQHDGRDAAAEKDRRGGAEMGRVSFFFLFSFLGRGE